MSGIKAQQKTLMRRLLKEARTDSMVFYLRAENPTLRAVTVPKRGVTETIIPEHGFWNGQMPVSGVLGGDLVSVRFFGTRLSRVLTP